MRYYIFLLFLPMMFGCSSNSGTKSRTANDSISTQVDGDSLLAADMDDFDWTPEEFKKEHPDEWAVVKPAINIGQ